MVRRILFFIGIFFLMFPPHLVINNFTIKTVYLFVVIPGIIGGIRFFLKRESNIVGKTVILFMIISLLYFTILSATIRFQDISLINEILMGFIIFFACSFYVNSYHKIYGDKFIVRLFLDLNIACIINSVIVIATYLSPEFKEFLYSFIGITETAKRYLFGDVGVARYQGIVPSGFSFLSTTHGLLLVVGVWAFYMNKENYRTGGIILFLLGQIVIFTAIILIGRTGIIVVLLFLSALVFYRINVIIQYLRASKKSIKLFLIFIVLITIMLLTVNFSKYKRNIDFAFELVISLTEKNTLDRSTSEVIKHHFFFPEKPTELLFGTGNFGRSRNLPYLKSDVGYVLFINGAGIIGMIVGYSFYFAGLFYSYKYRRYNQYLSWFVTVFFIAVLILNLKDYYFISHVGYSQVFFIAICALGKKIDWEHINDN